MLSSQNAGTGVYFLVYDADDETAGGRRTSANLQLPFSIFFCFSKRKRRLVRTGLAGTSPRCSRSLLSSESDSSSSNCKRFAGLQFEVRGDFDFPPDPLEPTKKPPSVFLDLSRDIKNSVEIQQTGKPMRIRTTFQILNAERFYCRY